MSAFTEMVLKWEQRGLTYFCFIIFVILYIIWDRRKSFAAIPSSRDWLGLAPITCGLLLYWLGELGGEFYTLYFSSWLILVGACWTYFGWRKLKELTFPFLFMFAMFPLPAFIYNKVSLKLQLISCRLGLAIIHLFGITSAFRDGNIVDLGVAKLPVINAFDGLRYLMPLLVLGLVLAYFFRSTFWKRALVVVTTIPLAIVFNAVRIAASGIIAVFWGSHSVEGDHHVFVEAIMLMASLAILLGLMRILGSRGKAGKVAVKSPRQAPEHSFPNEEEKDREKTAAQQFSRSGIYLCSIIIVVLVVMIALGNLIDFRKNISIRKPFSQFPLQIANWYGTPLQLDAEILKVLHLSNYAMIDFRNTDGNLINFYVAYYANQRKGKSIHSPATCLRGGGYIFKQSGTLALPIEGSNGKPIFIERALVQKNDDTELVYYWFPERGRILTNIWQLKVLNFWDALTTHRTDGALVRLITPVRSNEDVKSADKRLRRFTLRIWPLLETFLPGEKA